MKLEFVQRKSERPFSKIYLRFRELETLAKSKATKDKQVLKLEVDSAKWSSLSRGVEMEN